jgi:hypothetical protein
VEGFKKFWKRVLIMTGIGVGLTLACLIVGSFALTYLAGAQ